jgi:antirestriction protein ArdC
MSTLEKPKQVGPRSTEGKRPEVDAAVEKLDSAIERLLNEPGALREYLRYKGAMHHYSWNNLLLIMIDAWQRELDGPILTMGYQGWKKQGRNVRKGSKAIALFKPVIIKLDEPDEQGRMSKCVGFEIIRKTFHVQDTDGPDFEPPLPIPPDANGENERNLCKWLSRTALDDCGITKIIRSSENDKKLGQANGCYVPSTSEIWIKSDITYGHAAKTLAHEMAHCIVEHGKTVNYASERGVCEAIAEGAAFVVMSHYGYDTSDYSVPYIGAWAGDTTTVKQVLKDIADVAKAIIDKTTARMEAASDG